MAIDKLLAYGYRLPHAALSGRETTVNQQNRTLTLIIEALANDRWSYELRVNDAPHCGGVRDSFDAVITAARDTLKYYSPITQPSASVDDAQVAA